VTVPSESLFTRGLRVLGPAKLRAQLAAVRLDPLSQTPGERWIRWLAWRRVKFALIEWRQLGDVRGALHHPGHRAAVPIDPRAGRCPW
jgi:hypothetical protein